MEDFFANIYIILKWVLDELPNFPALPTTFVDKVKDFQDVIHSVSFIIPVKTFSLALAYYVLVSNMQFFVSMWNWIIRKIPFIS